MFSATSVEKWLNVNFLSLLICNPFTVFVLFVSWHESKGCSFCSCHGDEKMLEMLDG